MFYAYKLIGSLIVPPGLFCLATAFFSFLLFRTKGRKSLSAAMLILTLSIWFMSTSVGSYAITGGLERKYANSLPVIQSPVAFLVLAGGSSYDRTGAETIPGVRSLERVFSAVTSADPQKDVLIFSGGQVYGYGKSSESKIMEDCAKKMGWKGRVMTEEYSRTTAENMLYSGKMLSNTDYEDIVIVTNAFHMPRSMLWAHSAIREKRLFSLSGGLETYPGFRGLPDLFPDAHNFYLSCLGIKEWIGILAFRVLG